MKAKINFDGTLFFDVVLSCHQYSLKERIKSSLKVFFVLLVCAIVSILIPVLHFFLVPLFLLLSVIVSYRKFKEIKSIDLRNLDCPVCKQQLNAKQMGLKLEDWSIRLSCEHCRKNMTIVLENKE